MRPWPKNGREASSPRPTALSEQRIELLHGFTFDIWLQCMKEVIGRWLQDRSSIDEDQHPYLYLMLGKNYPGMESFGFAYSDVRHFLRAASDVCEADGKVVLDFTGLVQEGY